MLARNYLAHQFAEAAVAPGLLLQAQMVAPGLPQDQEHLSPKKWNQNNE